MHSGDCTAEPFVPSVKGSPVCPQCHLPFTRVPRGRRRIYCCTNCRVRAYDRREAQALLPRGAGR